jgi:hypothetical protein
MGWTNSPLENIVLDNVRVEIAKTSEVPGGFYDERPPGLFKGIFTYKLAGLYARSIRDLTLHQVRVVWGLPSNPSYGLGLDQADVDGMRLDQVSLDPAPQGPREAR